MPNQQIDAVIASIVLSVLPDESKIRVAKMLETQDDVQVEDLNIDSLKMVEVLMGIEEKLGVEIDLEEFEEMKTLGELSRFCQAQGTET